MLVGCWDGRLYLLEEDGKIRWSFRTGGGITSSPSIFDLNSDGRPEVIFGSLDRNIYCLDSSGKKLWGIGTEGEIRLSSPAIADFDCDGFLEAVVGSRDGIIYFLRGYGELIGGFKGGEMLASPGAADLDGDGAPEAVCAVWNQTLLGLRPAAKEPLWKRCVGGNIISSPVVADLDGDGAVEVVVATCSGELGIFGFGKKPSSPELKLVMKIPINSPVSAPIVIGDPDADGKLELMVGFEDGYLRCFEMPGGGEVIWAKRCGDPWNTGAYHNALSYGRAVVSGGMNGWYGTLHPKLYPFISIEPSELDFGKVLIGSVKKLLLIVENKGPGGLLIRLSSSDPSVKTTLTLLEVPAGRKAEVEVKFHPQKISRCAGQLMVESNDPERPLLRIPFEGKAVRLGDVTGNGKITALDASWVLRSCAGLKVLSEDEAKIADVNGDGKVTPRDAGLILKCVVGLINSFPGERSPGNP
ncbi:hypothetical protein DRP77_07730 [Candidatus Poribacteria bacterium]|nr:MAG: hypothetical protein DRP77_07730 [Candidatus Poribacteria bacterium]